MSLRRALWASQRFPGGSGLWRGGLWTSQRAASATAQVRSLLFGAGQQGAFYCPIPVVDGVQVLWQDSAGTTPVTADGQVVGRIDDLSGNGNHAVQSTTAAKPIYRTDGTLHRLAGDGVDDFMRSSDLAGAKIDTFTIIHANTFSPQSLDVAFVPFSLGALDRDGVTADASVFGAADDSSLRYQGGFNNPNPTDLPETPPTIVSASREGLTVNAWFSRVHNIVNETRSQSTDTRQNVYLFSHQDIRFTESDFYGSVAVLSILTDSQRMFVEDYFASLAGETL